MAELLATLYILMIPKGHTHKIAYYLNANEFACKCQHESCHYTLVSEELLIAWSGLRAAWGRPLKLNSAFRCAKHNDEVGGVKDSNHTRGMAIDIDTSEMSHEEYVRFNELAAQEFDYCIAHESFTHCQVNR